MKKYSSYYTKKNDKKYCLDVEGGQECDNVRIISYSCHKGNNQKFHYTRKNQLKSKSSKRCLDISKDGPQVIQKKCQPTKKSQKWKRIGKKWLSLANNKCLETTAYNGKLITYKCHNGPNQQFTKE